MTVNIVFLCGVRVAGKGKEKGREEEEEGKGRPEGAPEAASTPIRGISSSLGSLTSQPGQYHPCRLPRATPGKGLAQDQQRTAGKLAKYNTQIPNKHPTPYVPLHTRVCSVPGTRKTLSRCWIRRHGEATTKTQLCASVGRNEPAHSPPTGRNYQSIL